MLTSKININDIDSKTVRNLASNYNILDYQPKIKQLLSGLTNSVCFDGVSKFEMHHFINEVIIQKYRGEVAAKSFLVDEFINKKVIAAFEIKVNNSRVDFLTINGDTRSFEIKSELDNLGKLAKQVNDYKKVFEYNYIAIDEKHYENAKKIVPSEYGIWCFINGQKFIAREAIKNTELDGELQLKLFNKKEFAIYFKNLKTAQEVLSKFDFAYINKVFKSMLKKRYSKRWEFLKSNKESILPINYQFFFNSNIDPKIIYNC